MFCYFSIPTPANCIVCKYTPIIVFSYFKCSLQYVTLHHKTTKKSPDMDF